MPIGDIYQLSVDQLLFGVALTNTHYFRQESPDAPSDTPSTLIEAYINDLLPLQLAMQSQDCVSSQIRVIRVHPIPSQATLQSITSPGTIVAESHPANICSLGGLYGTAASTAPQGRNFFAGIPMANINRGLLTDAALVLLQSFITRLLSNIQDPTSLTDWQRVLFKTLDDTVFDLVQAIARPASRKLRSRTKQTT